MGCKGHDTGFRSDNLRIDCSVNTVALDLFPRWQYNVKTLSGHMNESGRKRKMSQILVLPKGLYLVTIGNHSTNSSR